MKKYLFIIWILFSVLEKNTAQDGIIAIARYGQTEAPKFRYNDSLTEFSGGFAAFKTLFLKEFKTPTKALRGRKAPDGMVGFTVSLVGKIVDIEIMDSVTTEIDAEVVRVLSEISEFHPQVKPLKFAIVYNVYPDWFRDWVQEQEEDEKRRLQAAKMDSLLKNTKVVDLKKYVDKKQTYMQGNVWVGFSTMNGKLAKYLKTGFVLGGDLNFCGQNWFGGAHFQIRGSQIKEEFEYSNQFWAKDTSVSLFSVSLMAGYKIIEEEQLAFAPFVGLGFGSLGLPSTEDVESASIPTFAPTFGLYVDYKIKEKAVRSLFEPQLSVTTIRFRLALNPMNFNDGRRGSVVDLGVGLSFSRRVLRL